MRVWFLRQGLIDYEGDWQQKQRLFFKNTSEQNQKQAENVGGEGMDIVEVSITETASAPYIPNYTTVNVLLFNVRE